ncbi:hypothetical protein BaRGS_00034035, partial [Batillaria attramentaria]
AQGRPKREDNLETQGSISYSIADSCRIAVPSNSSNIDISDQQHCKTSFTTTTSQLAAGLLYRRSQNKHVNISDETSFTTTTSQLAAGLLYHRSQNNHINVEH